MIQGMTGFGQAEVSIGQIKVAIEVKSVNHRYLDLSYYLPIGFGSLEGKIRQIIEKFIQRGRVNISIKISQKSTQVILLNKDFVKEYLENIQILKKDFGLKNDVTVSDIIALPGVFETKEKLIDPNVVWPTLEKGLRRSLVGLMNMRKSEGRSLLADVMDQLKRMAVRIKKIQARLKIILNEKKRVLTKDEFLSFQKGSDVNEEISRMLHYIDELKMHLKAGDSIGKKIDFIAQEMQRETNTIGSKVQDTIISSAVIALKSKIEKIREQSQNIE